MNCIAVQRRLLEAENPDQPHADLRPHLAVCSACREWQRRLVQLERNMPLLPVPASTAPADIFLKVPQEAGKSSQEAGRRNLRLRFSAPRGRRLVMAVSGVAAALLLVLLGWGTLREPPVKPRPKVVRAGPDPLVERLLQRDLGLAKAQSHRERLVLLGELADDLHVETRALARTAGAEDLQELARLYRQVVHDGILERARTLPANERRQVLDPIADRLARAGRDAEKLAQEVPSAAGPLQVVAEAAREGHGRLRTLVRGETQ
jgi:hypothetical protein